MTFSHRRSLIVFHRSLSDCQSPQISPSLLSFLANFNNVVVWMISIHPPIFNSSSHFTNPLGTIPSASITISISLLLCSTTSLVFLQGSKERQVLVSFYVFFDFHFVIRRDGNVYYLAGLFFLLLIIARSDLQSKITGSACISNFQRSLCHSLSRADTRFCICHLVSK